MKTGILFPMPKEMGDFAGVLRAPVQERCGRLTVWRGGYGAEEIIAVVSGICKTNAAAAACLLAERYGAERILLCGVAGSLEKTLLPRSTVVLTEVSHHDIDPSILNPDEPGQAICAEHFCADPALLQASMEALRIPPQGCPVFWGPGVSGECFLQKAERKDVVEKFSALCVDMETAAVAQVCALLGLPWLGLRAISDNAGQGYEENVIPATIAARTVLLRLLDTLCV